MPTASKRFQEVEKSGKFILIEGIDYIGKLNHKVLVDLNEFPSVFQNVQHFSHPRHHAENKPK